MHCQNPVPTPALSLHWACVWHRRGAQALQETPHITYERKQVRHTCAHGVPVLACVVEHAATCLQRCSATTVGEAGSNCLNTDR
eukprot:14102068-Alexandrium_andersonii.AAC.1